MLSRSAPAGAAPARGEPARAKGARAVTVRGTPGRVRGSCVAGVGHTSRARGAPGPAPPPFWAGCHERPAGGVIQGGRGATPQEETGRPCQCTGGRCGRGGPQRPCRGGAPGMAPALWGACHARPAGGFIQAGGAERRRGRRRGAPFSVEGPIKTGQAGPTGEGRGSRRLPAVTSPTPPPETRVSPPPLSPIPLVLPTFLLGRGGHDILAVNESDADGGDDVPKC